MDPAGAHQATGRGSAGADGRLRIGRVAIACTDPRRPTRARCRTTRGRAAIADLMGVLVGCFRPPSVPDGVSRLRLVARAGIDPGDVADATKAAAHMLRRR
ncbi:hypothetical protein ACFPM0_13370 [Pseudonocardia sulfidoxydans]|uniref:hypothetical protein n=1 Tax=Pseudonocardia sulfidoxydans TaxID=54011 RepID=UPI003617E1D9